MDIAQLYQQSFEDSDKYRAEVMVRTIANLPALPVEPAKVSHSTLYDLWLTYPYNRALMAQIDEALKAQGWEVSFAKTEADITTSWDSPRTCYRKTLAGFHSASVIIEYSDLLPGAVCKRREVGEVAQTTTVKAFDFACP
jgi:hypothetical protein